MQPRTIDHVVWPVQNLEGAANAAARAGFCLTPKAQHPEHMGTSNQLIQFANQSFVEFLEVDRPNGIAAHRPQQLFSFGGYNQAFLRRGSGISMLVFRTEDADADVREFEREGFADFPSFEFGRKAIGPDGKISELSFRLAFAVDKDLAGLACFTCENRFPENFWRAEFQDHSLMTEGIREIAIVASEPERTARRIASIARSRVKLMDEEWQVACGNRQLIRVLPDALDDRRLDVEVAAERVIAVVLDADRQQTLSDPTWGQSRIILRGGSGDG